MQRMAAAFAFVVVVLLASDSVHSVFVTTPAVITPKKTENVVLRCDPQLQDAVAILAIHIRKKTEQAAEKPKQSQEESKADVKTQPEVKEEAPVQVAEKPNNEPKQPEYPRYDNSINFQRKKRSSETDFFVRATITAGNNLDVVPQKERFNAVGDVQKPAYLSVTIDNPDVNDLGVFECQATFLDTSGSIQTSSELAQVKETENLTLEDLEWRVKKLEEMAPVYRVVINEVENIAKDAKSLNAQLETDMASLRKENDELKQTVLELTDEMKSLSSRMTTISEQFGFGRTSVVSSDNNEPHEGQLRSDQMYKASARIDQMTNIHIQTLAEHLKQLKDYERDTQDRVTVLELTVNGKMDERIRKIEAFNWQAIAESLQEIEMKTIPLMQKQILDCQKNVTTSQSGPSETSKDESQVVNDVVPLTTTLPQTPPVTIPETTPITYTGPACYVCGNNETEQHCPISMVKNTEECSSQEPYCLTELYQNGVTRHVYKRCASVRECRRLTQKSSPNCATDSFVSLTSMECHFCCTSILCNEHIRPSKDLI